MFAPSVRIIIHRASTARGEGEEGRDGWIVNIVEEGRMYTVRQRNHSRVHNMTVDCLPVNSWSTWSSPWVVSCQHWQSIYPGCLYLPVCVSHTPPYSSLQSLCFHSPPGSTESWASMQMMLPSSTWWKLWEESNKGDINHLTPPSLFSWLSRSSDCLQTFSFFFFFN